MNFSDIILDSSIKDIVALTYGARITLVLDSQKRTKSWLAQEIGISKQALGYLMAYGSKPKLLDEISMALGVNSEWLKTGKGNITTNHLENDTQKSFPVIALNEVNDFIQGKIDSNNKKSIISAYTLSDKCFSIVLESNYLYPIFSHGTILIFDSEITPKNGDFVIFFRDKDHETLIGQLFKDGSNINIRPIDGKQGLIENEKITFYGVLIESRNMFK